MDEGLYNGIPNDNYHAGEGISKSGLALVLRSGAHYDQREFKKETPALKLGSAIDDAVFEPASFLDKYSAKPEGMSFATKEGKAWREDREGTIILTRDEYNTCEGIAENVRMNPTAAEYLSAGESQISGYWTDPNNGLLCKLRMDWLNKEKRAIVDLKSCMDARPHAFTNDAYKYHYDMQAFWYLYGLSRITGIEHKDFYFIVAEKAPPFAVQVYKASEEFITSGGVRCARALGIYAECMEKNEWPPYPPDCLDLGLPGWVKKKDDYTIFE